jgi:hypothetical protein
MYIADCYLYNERLRDVDPVKKIFSSETAGPNGAKLGRKHLCKILYKTSSFGSIQPTNMATVTISG